MTNNNCCFFILTLPVADSLYLCLMENLQKTCSKSLSIVQLCRYEEAIVLYFVECLERAEHTVEKRIMPQEFEKFPRMICIDEGCS